jgi:flagellar motor switch/type III secretory pathway protein FliN
MAETGPHIAERILAACQHGAAAAGKALATAFGAEIAIAPPEALLPYNPAAPDPAWLGPGLIFSGASRAGATILLPNADGLLPAWCADRAEPGRGRVLALAKEFATRLFPLPLAPRDFDARWVSDLAAAAIEHDPGKDARVISMALSAGSRKGVLSLLVPHSIKPPAAGESNENDSSAESPTPLPASRERVVYERIEDALPYLPVYSRSLLKIKVPVRVTLASTKLPVRKIVELSPGTLIQFPKLCEEALDLEVGQRPVARGEAVKIGEKFGLRITSIVLPGERFVRLAPQR